MSDLTLEKLILKEAASGNFRAPPGVAAASDHVTTDIIRLASRFGRYGYRRITAMLRSEGWTVNAKRIWRREAEGSSETTEKRQTLAE